MAQRSFARTRRGNCSRGFTPIITLLLSIPQAILALFSSYLLLLTGVAWFRKSTGRAQTDLPARPTTRFLILVPAHDEERLIGTTMRSLRALDYPKNMYSVHVVADNCVDATAAIARDLGAEVHERTDKLEQGKGRALMWLLHRLWERGDPHDAVVFVDADTTVDRRFLRVMDAKMRQGFRAVQGYYAVRDPATSRAVGLRYAAFALRHYLRPLGRTALGGSAGLFGNGMVFAADVVRDYQWTNHLTEDAEMHVHLLLDGIVVGFAPDALVHAEMPSSIARSGSQQDRWERGRIDLARRYIPRLLASAREPTCRQRLARIDTAVDQALPPLSVLALATVGTGLAAAGLTHRCPSRATRALRSISVATALGNVIYVFVGLRLVRAPRSVYRSLLAAPLLAGWKAGRWMRLLLRPSSVTWTRTQRNSEHVESVGALCGR